MNIRNNKNKHLATFQRCSKEKHKEYIEQDWGEKTKNEMVEYGRWNRHKIVLEEKKSHHENLQETEEAAQTKYIKQETLQ